MRILITAVLGLVAFLSISFFGNFVTKAEFSVINTIKTDIEYLKKGQDEIKSILRGN